MRKLAVLSLVAVLSIPVFIGCQPIVSENENNWLTYDVRDGLEFSEAWTIVVDALLTRGYEFETLVQDDGYIKTEYLHETVDELGVEVQTRISVKFTYGRRTIRMKVDEIYLSGYKEPGVDIPRVADLKQDLRDRLL